MLKFAIAIFADFIKYRTTVAQFRFGPVSISAHAAEWFQQDVCWLQTTSKDWSHLQSN